MNHSPEQQHRYMESLSQPTKRSHKYEQSRSLMTMSRLYDNHFDRDLHEKPWISLGIFKTDKMVKYEHSDAGIAFHNLKIKKLRTFQELWEKNQEITDKQHSHQGFRQFREFQDLQEEDVIVTIEYCTNCHEHTGSTKHDEAKYLRSATQLKNEILARFPIVKVILKPLIYDHFDHSIDTMFIQRRLGCFEVQCSSKQRGQLKQAVVYSKLNTKEWPANLTVINRLPQFFKKVSFSIQLKFEDSNQVIPSVDVKIQPFRIVSKEMPKKQTLSRSLLQQSNPQFGQQTIQSNQFNHQSERYMRPQSTTQTRPKSAISAQSQKSLKSKQGTQTQQMPNPEEDMHMIQRSNKDGKITLNNVPLDVYEVIINETNDFIAENKKINLFDLVERNEPLDQIIYLRKQTLSCISILLFDQQVAIPYARLELIPSSSQKEAIVKESPPGSGKYEIVVEPGRFLLKVKKEGYNVYEELITTKTGVCPYTYQIQTAQPGQGYDPVADALEKKLSIKPSTDLYVKKPKFLNPPSEVYAQVNLIQFQFIDLVQKKPVQDVYIKVFDEANNKLYSYRSNADGVCKSFITNKILKGKIIIEHGDYYSQDIEINEQSQLSSSKVNLYYIIKKPQQGQLVVLIVNKPESEFVNFYVLQENRVIIQSDGDIKQYANRKDGIQYIEFSNLTNKKDILQLVACVPSLELINSVENIYVLSPSMKVPQGRPVIPEFTSVIRPYFWIIGSLKEPYESFDVVNEIIENGSLQDYPSLIKARDNTVLSSVFQSPNILVASTLNQNISIWNLDTYTIDQKLIVADNIVTMLGWDDDNVVGIDTAQNLVWLKKDDTTQKYGEIMKLQVGNGARSLTKVGSECLVVGSQTHLMLVSVRLDIRSVFLTIDEVTEQQVMNLLTVANDQIMTISDTINQIKVEKSLDRPLQSQLLKQLPLPKTYNNTQIPLMQIVQLDQRYLFYGGLDGLFFTLNIETQDKSNNVSFTHFTGNSFLQNEDSLMVISQSHITVVQTPEILGEVKQHIIRNFDSPVPLYSGPAISYEKRLITFSAEGQLLVWALYNKQFPPLSEFLKPTEFPHKLLAKKECYLLVESRIPKENLSLYLINENGEQISESQGALKFERAEDFSYLEVNTTKQTGLWRICGHLQNTELIKQQQPKMYFIHRNGYQIISLPQQLPQSRKQAYNWFIGTLIPQVEQLKIANLYTDQQINKFASLEQVRHQGKVNQILIFEQQFITCGEDRTVNIWDQGFRPVKTLVHEFEVLSLLLYQNAICSGLKDGSVVIWKFIDQIWVQEAKFKPHEKGVLSIIFVDNSIVTSSEDRKIVLSNWQNQSFETSETVDRSYVISLVVFAKDSFAAGFPDGRVKTYKREKSSQKVVLKTLRTTVTVKVQHLLLMPQFVLFVGGMDKVSDLINVDTGIKLKTFKDGHQGAILCSQAYHRFILTGGSDGRLNVYNAEKGTSLKVIELQKEEIRGMLVIGRLLITAGSNGVIKIWQEIIPQIDAIPIEEEEQQ